MSTALGAIVRATESESAAWAASLLPSAARGGETPWEPLCGPAFADGLEAIYEGYLLHHGHSRLFALAHRDEALLCGDFLYARGLAWVAERHDTEAVAALADLIALAAHGRAEAAPPDDFALWAATALFLADRGAGQAFALAREELRRSGASGPLETLLAGRELAAARAAHAALAPR